ncbi:MAG: hypothetical protein ACRD0W_11510 [Acidimicrobiales bacterium]
MATVLERIPVDRINAEARDVQVGRSLLTLIAGFFYLLGWLAGKLVVGVAWCFAAVRVGWREARATPARLETARPDGGG